MPENLCSHCPCTIIPWYPAHPPPLHTPCFTYMAYAYSTLKKAQVASKHVLTPFILATVYSAGTILLFL